MRTVRDDDGNKYLLLKESAESSLVRDPETGEERYLPNDGLKTAGESPLGAAARSVPRPIRRALSAAHDDRSLGLLVELDRRDAVAVRDLLGDYDLCESDLHGAVAEFRAAGLVKETRVAGERGYELTDEGRKAIAKLQD